MFFPSTVVEIFVIKMQHVDASCGAINTGNSLLILCAGYYLHASHSRETSAVCLHYVSVHPVADGKGYIIIIIFKSLL